MYDMIGMCHYMCLHFVIVSCIMFANIFFFLCIVYCLYIYYQMHSVFLQSQVLKICSSEYEESAFIISQADA